MVHKIKRQDRNQHQQSTQLREEKKLHRRVDASFVAPYDDEKIHRDQHQFPGKIEEEQVEGQENADDSRQNPHEVEVEEPDSLVDLRPGGEHGHDAEEECEQQHQQARDHRRQDESGCQSSGSSSS